MSISIVSTLPGSEATAKTAASNAAASGFFSEDLSSLPLDFASLLFAQLQPAPETPAPLTEKLMEKAEEKTAVASDAANLLAVAGLATVESLAVKGSQAAVESSQAFMEQAEKPLAALSDGLPKAELPVGEKDLPETITADKTIEIAAKPAKFAASSTVNAETPVSEPLTENRQSVTPPVVPAANLPHHSAAAQPMEKTAIETPVHDRSWQDVFTQKVVWLAGNDRQSAQITLNPPQMGPIEIALNIDKGNATASFVSANADVRESIETALPRLREMFAGIGLELGQANVSEESFRPPMDHHDAHAGTRWTGDQAILVTQTGMQGAGMFAQRDGRGLVDTFA